MFMMALGVHACVRASRSSQLAARACELEVVVIFESHARARVRDVCAFVIFVTRSRDGARVMWLFLRAQYRVNGIRIRTCVHCLTALVLVHVVT